MLYGIWWGWVFMGAILVLVALVCCGWVVDVGR